MIEKCNFCQPAVDNFREHIKFDKAADEKAVLAEMILAYGKVCGCDEDRLTCLPLIKIMEEL
jgi:hypothetical protein